MRAPSMPGKAASAAQGLGPGLHSPAPLHGAAAAAGGALDGLDRGGVWQDPGSIDPIAVEDVVPEAWRLVTGSLCNLGVCCAPFSV